MSENCCENCDCNDNSFSRDSLPTISTNEVKAGAVVYFKDGRIGQVMDNRRGNLRMVKVEVYGMSGYFDIGDEYVFGWSVVDQNKTLYRPVLTPKQEKDRDFLVDSGWLTTDTVY